ncbi:MAG TPA: tetratricopeptide repeat protein [Candidatus Eisenbacteria bacterium]|nr:tetratricopeptide repeat protein [Candidatus Eisenbacteria bacterium]
MSASAFRPALAALAAALLLAGCGNADRAQLFRAEKLLYDARKAEDEVRLAGKRPDSTTALRLRANYLKVRTLVPGPYNLNQPEEKREVAMSTLRAVGVAEAAGVRLALEARRADLALEAAERLQTAGAADTATARQAAFMALAAYQGLRRYEDVVAQMKRILATYPPLPPGPNGEEDPVLGLPAAIVNLRRGLGDEAGAARELRGALEYFEGLLARPMPPVLEAQVRARILRANLELNQAGRALQEANALERLVASTPSLRHMMAEIAFAKGKIKTGIDADPSEGIGILERVAMDFPQSPLAPRAIFEVGASFERRTKYQSALERYQEILKRFPYAADVAPLALYRIGIVQEKMEDWGAAKSTFESIPVRYPRSTSAAEAPIAVIQHFMREGRKTVAQQYMTRAIGIYRELVKRDSTGEVTPLFRVKMFQLSAAQGDSNGVYAVTEEMLRSDPKHPYTAQILIEASRAAKGYGNPSRAAVYLRRFLREFPKSPLAGQVQQELRRLEG